MLNFFKKITRLFTNREFSYGIFGFFLTEMFLSKGNLVQGRLVSQAWF